MRRCVVAFGVALVVSLLASPSASAGVAWRVDALSDSTVAAGGQLTYLLQVTNVGDTDAPLLEGEQLTAQLPPGVTVASGGFASWPFVGLGAGVCSPSDPPDGLNTFSCTLFGAVPHRTSVPPAVNGGAQPISLTVDVPPSAAGVLTSRFTVTDPNAPGPATTASSTRVTPSPPPFGMATVDGQTTANAAGDPLTQAGGHPYSASVSIDFNTELNANPLIGPLWPTEQVKDVITDLPAGFTGYPPAAAKCTAPELVGLVSPRPGEPLCASTSQVGTTLVRINGSGTDNVLGPIPVYNMVPPPNAPAQFGFNLEGSVVTLNARVRADAHYSLAIDAVNIPEALPIASTTVTLWGVPADPSHDGERACPGQVQPFEVGGGGPTCSSGAPPVAFLRYPTSCEPTVGADGLATAVHIDSWEHPGALTADGGPDLSDPNWVSASFTTHLPPAYPNPSSEWGAHTLPTGCDKEPFTPTFKAAAAPPVSASSPAGFNFDLSMPQSSDPSSIGQADLRKAVVTFPQGVAINPSSASGLQACSPAQIGLGSTAEPSCPEGSRIGTLKLRTPLQENELEGSVYLATPHENPFGSLIALYQVIRGPGFTIKLPGRVDLDPATGQVTATFDELPQLPFERLHIELEPGPTASLLTPSACGTYTTHSVLSSWSGKTVASDSSFTVDHGPGGGACAPQGFAPGFSAGGANPLAGAFSPFKLRLTRTDADSGLNTLSSLSLPPGLLADVASVPVRCSEVQALAHACPAASHVGTVTTGTGAGSNPFYVSGDVFLMGQQTSGPFAGDPFGLAFVVHAVAGPFDLGYVVVKAGTQIHDDGSISTVSEPFPSILEGIPLDLRDVRVALDRPGFIFNPTSCAPMGISGSLTSLLGQTAALSQRFQVGDCGALTFKPRFSASTQAKTSKAGGASLHVHLASGEGPHSPGAPGEANIARVDVQLPVALPARLPTLQKACTAGQFAKDPAGCPEGSFVGSAVARTPVISSALSGPAILVSHGGEAFPDLVLVLQGEGVHVDLTGHTQIKNGVTFSHFDTVPDAPVSSFDLTLPEGPHGALTTDNPGVRDLCATTRTVVVKRRVTRRVNGHRRRVIVRAKRSVSAALLMPTTITAQNGMVVNQNTRIAVTGCPKAKKVKAKGGSKAGKSRGRR
jgi:hypothetical protein